MKELLNDCNEYQENTTNIGFQFHSPKLSRESCFTLPVNYDGLYKERSTKEAIITSNAEYLKEKSFSVSLW